MKLRKPVGHYDKERMKVIAKLVIDSIENPDKDMSLAFILFQEGERMIVEGHCAVCDDCKRKYAEIYEHACKTKDCLFNYEQESISQ